MNGYADTHVYEQRRAETRDSRINRARGDLIDEFVTAAQRDADAPVRAPAEPRGTVTAGEILLSCIDGADTDSWDMRRKVLEALTFAAKSTDPTVRLPALAVLVQMGVTHAKRHEAELAEQCA